MTDRTSALNAIAVGDIIHASATNGASFPSLVLEVTEGKIMARRVTTQDVHVFDRRTGISDADGSPITIDSVAPLPPDIFEVMLGLDRKYGTLIRQYAANPDWIGDPEASKLTEAEKHGLLFIAKFYPSNPI